MFHIMNIDFFLYEEVESRFIAVGNKFGLWWPRTHPSCQFHYEKQDLSITPSQGLSWLLILVVQDLGCTWCPVVSDWFDSSWDQFHPIGDTVQKSSTPAIAELTKVSVYKISSSSKVIQQICSCSCSHINCWDVLANKSDFVSMLPHHQKLS